MQIHSGEEEPRSAFAAVRYRDHWYWVSGGDLSTKRAHTVVMFFFTLANSGSSDGLPVVTIPAQ